MEECCPLVYPQWHRLPGMKAEWFLVSHFVLVVLVLLVWSRQLLVFLLTRHPTAVEEVQPLVLRVRLPCLLGFQRWHPPLASWFVALSAVVWIELWVPKH